MAKLERTLNEDFDQLLARIDSGILNGSISASHEDGSDFAVGGTRCSVRVYERYSWFGGNRVSLTVTLFRPDPEQPVQLSAITSGGSQGVLMKVNTVGEENFLHRLEQLL